MHFHHEQDDPATNDQAEKILNRILLLASPLLIEEVFKLFPAGAQERIFLQKKLKAIKEKTASEASMPYDVDAMIDAVGDTLDFALSEQTFYQTLEQFISRAGYRKVSDFYNRLNIDRRYWNRYARGAIPPKEKLIEMIFFLSLSYEDAEYLINIAGYALRRNQMSDVIVLYFLRNESIKQMQPEELLIMLDAVLINFDEPPIHSLEE